MSLVFAIGQGVLIGWLVKKSGYSILDKETRLQAFQLLLLNAVLTAGFAEACKAGM